MTDRLPQVLFLCTANRCRSPVAAAMFEREVRTRGMAATVRSAGLLPPGTGVPKEGVAVGREFGLDLEPHLSTRLEARMIEDADLVLALAREHAREAVAAAPSRWPRTFTVRQFRRWVDAATVPHDTPLGPWLDGAAAGRPRTDFIGASPEDDVADPIGRPARVWRSILTELDAEIIAIVDRLEDVLPRS